jgi:hypothetical protein
VTWKPALKIRTVLLYMFGSNLAAGLSTVLILSHRSRLAGTGELVFWMALNLCAIHLPHQWTWLLRQRLAARLLGPFLILSSLAALLLTLSGHHSGYHLYVWNCFLLAGFALAVLRRRYEKRCLLDPAFLRQASDLELKLLEAAIKVGATTENPFHALENILGGDPFDTELMQARNEALNRLIAARYVSYEIPEQGSLKQLAPHPDAETLLSAERERRENLWSSPAPKPGPRQRSSALAERAL